MNTLISVIVPIYNVEQYLEECCDSILSQTYTNIEVILVNDGSTDNSLAIASRIAAKDERIVLVNRENGGLSAARNTGMLHASGEYILFVDSDDWIEPDCLELLFGNIRQYGADVSCCHAQYVDEHGIKKSSRSMSGLKSICAPELLIDALLVNNFRTSACCKLYNREFLERHQLRFQEGIVNEDTLFSLQVACVATKVSFVDRALFDIREREGSISRSSYKRLFLDMDTALDLAQQYMKQCGLYTDQIDKLYKARYLRSTLYNLLQIAQRLSYSNYCSDYKACMEGTKYKDYQSYASYLPLKHRVMCALSLYPSVFYRIVRILNTFGFRMH